MASSRLPARQLPTGPPPARPVKWRHRAPPHRQAEGLAQLGPPQLALRLQAALARGFSLARSGWLAALSRGDPLPHRARGSRRRCKWAWPQVVQGWQGLARVVGARSQLLRRRRLVPDRSGRRCFDVCWRGTSTQTTQCPAPRRFDQLGGLCDQLRSTLHRTHEWSMCSFNDSHNQCTNPDCDSRVPHRMARGSSRLLTLLRCKTIALASGDPHTMARLHWVGFTPVAGCWSSAGPLHYYTEPKRWISVVYSV